jgi:glycosyltransferase involved in cell wall biosynthesis
VNAASSSVAVPISPRHLLITAQRGRATDPDLGKPGLCLQRPLRRLIHHGIERLLRSILWAALNKRAPGAQTCPANFPQIYLKGYRPTQFVEINVTIVADTLTTGGAETFVLRLARALQSRVGSVQLFVLRRDRIEPGLAKQVSSTVPIHSARIPAIRTVMRLDGLLFLIGASFSLLRWLQVRALQKHILATNTDVVHSHLLTSDLVASRAAASLGRFWLTTLHGDYLELSEQGQSRAGRIIDVQKALEEVARTARQIVCITDQQVAHMSTLFPNLMSQGRLSKIYNGYSVEGDEPRRVIPCALREIPKGDFVIGMVARGIREKGWDILIRAFLELDLARSWLVLVGDGRYLQELRVQIGDGRLVFVGNVDDPLSYIAQFDVCCLPTFYQAESLPTVIIEYLLSGKPVIATNIGEIRSMVEAGTDHPAGMLIELDTVDRMVSQMKKSILDLRNDPAKRNRLSANATRAAQKFNMETCVESYVALYCESLQQDDPALPHSA